MFVSLFGVFVFVFCFVFLTGKQAKKPTDETLATLKTFLTFIKINMFSQNTQI